MREPSKRTFARHVSHSVRKLNRGRGATRGNPHRGEIHLPITQAQTILQTCNAWPKANARCSASRCYTVMALPSNAVGANNVA